MDKKCAYCDFSVENDVNFCPKCGENEFIPLNIQTTAAGRSIKILKLLISVIACLLVIAVSVFSFTGFFDGLVYTKGTIEDDVYINTWANIRYESNNICPISDASRYKSLEDDVTQIGFAYMPTNTNKLFTLYFEYLQGEIMTAKEYLNAVKETLRSQIEMFYTSGPYSTETIAGEEYTRMTITIPNSTMVIRYYVRIHGKYAIVFLSRGFAVKDIDKIFDQYVSEV